MRKDQFLESALVHLWEAMHDLEALQGEEELDYFRVSIFGSSRIQPEDALYEDVRFLARELAKMGCDIVTGGGPGLMEAANLGAKEGNIKGLIKSYGLPIKLPLKEEQNPYLDKIYKHKSFFSRLHHFVRLSSAFVAMEGGIGTTLEVFMIWQLLQVKQIQNRPLILVGPLWQGLIQWAKNSFLPNKLADPVDLTIPKWVKHVKDALPIIQKAHQEYLLRARQLV